jgi:hypothetical protein
MGKEEVWLCIEKGREGCFGVTQQQRTNRGEKRLGKRREAEQVKKNSKRGHFGFSTRFLYKSALLRHFV